VERRFDREQPRREQRGGDQQQPGNWQCVAEGSLDHPAHCVAVATALTR
jgi:hypothetical protein